MPVLHEVHHTSAREKLMSRHRRKKTFPKAALAATAGGAVTLAAVFAASPSGGSEPHHAALQAAVLTAPNLETALRAPQAPRTYTVKAGDRLWGIAQKECRDGSKWRDLAKASHVINGNMLKIGERIIVSC